MIITLSKSLLLTETTIYSFKCHYKTIVCHEMKYSLGIVYFLLKHEKTLNKYYILTHLYQLH